MTFKTSYSRKYNFLKNLFFPREVEVPGWGGDIGCDFISHRANTYGTSTYRISAGYKFIQNERYFCANSLRLSSSSLSKFENSKNALYLDIPILVHQEKLLIVGSEMQLKHWIQIQILFKL